MSKGLENFLPFIESVSADYPWGDIKDGDGSGNGTDVNRENHADYHQTFRKILDKAYITPNGLPDNVTNGYQYVDALKFLYKNFRGIVPTSVGIILDKFYIRKIIYIDSATTLTGFIMPPSTDLDDTDSITIVNKTNYEVVIQTDGTDTVDLLPSISLLKAGDFAELVLDKGNGNWVLSNHKISTPPLLIPKPIYVYKNGGSIGSGTILKIPFNNAIIDIDSDFDITTNYEYTAPRSGVYRFKTQGFIHTPTPSTPTLDFVLYKNGSSNARMVFQNNLAGNCTFDGTNNYEFSGETFIELIQGEKVDFRIISDLSLAFSISQIPLFIEYVNQL